MNPKNFYIFSILNFWILFVTNMLAIISN